MATIDDIKSKEFDLIDEFNGVQLLLYKPKPSSKGVLFTKGLSKVDQYEIAGQEDQVHPHIELYFLLPTYWDLKKQNEQWPVNVLERLINAQVNKSAWFGPGDTLPAHPKKVIDDAIIDGGAGDENMIQPINSQFRQTHFMLAESLAADGLLGELSNGSFGHTWLAIIPIFQKEFEYKISRSALELLMKFEKNSVTEELDEHRPIVAKKRFFGLF